MADPDASCTVACITVHIRDRVNRLVKLVGLIEMV